MARPWLSASFLACVLIAAVFPVASAAAADPPPLPGSIAAVGDSISQAASSGGTLGADYPANSWATGTNTTVNSHYLRLLALNPAISGHRWNDSVSGAKVADLNAQMQVVVGQQPDYLTVLIGGNDLCTDTVAQMTTVADFTARFKAAMDTLTAGSSDTLVLVVSIPRVNQLWELFHTSFWARTVWSLGGICQSLLANPTSTQAADVARRAEVAQRNIDYNTALAQVCAQYAQCRFDGNAVYNVLFAKSDVSGDYFHPSIAGQAKLAAVSWATGYWPNGGPTQDTAPTAAFAFSCTGLTCSFDASTSRDDRGIVSYAWAFGDGGTGSGVTQSHIYQAAGAYTVGLTVTDTIGQTGAISKAVTVTAPSTATVHLALLSGEATLKKTGWIATVKVTAKDAAGAGVGGATVTGTWSTGVSGGCTTATDGTCSFNLNVGRKVPSVTWSLSGITATGYTYDSTANVDPSYVTIPAPK